MLLCSGIHSQRQSRRYESVLERHPVNLFLTVLYGKTSWNFGRIFGILDLFVGFGGFGGDLGGHIRRISGRFQVVAHIVLEVVWEVV